MTTNVANAALSPAAIAQGLSRDSCYFDHDTGMMEPHIPSTPENWENGKLGCDERYVSVAPAELTAQVRQALGKA